jgi:hypothetical protein
MKKLLICLFATSLFSAPGMAQEKRPPKKELKAQMSHVKSSGNDLLHLRFKRAHEKHVAEMKRRNRGIAKDLRGEGAPPPTPPPHKKIVIRPD